MTIALDLILVLLFVLIVFLSYRRGFVRTVVELAGYILICVVAFACTGPLSNWIYDTFMAEPVTHAVADAIETQVGDSAAAAAGDLGKWVTRMILAFRSWTTASRSSRSRVEPE